MKDNARKVEAVKLKHPLHSYPPRLERFLTLITRVRELSPRDAHLWNVMDMPSFQDTETALTVALINYRMGNAQP